MEGLNRVDDYKKEIMIFYLRSQVRQIDELIKLLEDENNVDQEVLTDFFSAKTKSEKRILSAVLN